MAQSSEFDVAGDDALWNDPELLRITACSAEQLRQSPARTVVSRGLSSPMFPENLDEHFRNFRPAARAPSHPIPVQRQPNYQPTNRVDPKKRPREVGLQVPLCPRHDRPCKVLVVKKEGKNKGRSFWVCSLPVDNKCDYFLWDSELKAPGRNKRVKLGNPITANSVVTLMVQVVSLSPPQFAISVVPPDRPTADRLRGMGGHFDPSRTSWTFPLAKYSAVIDSLARGLNYKLELPFPAVVKRFVESTPKPLPPVPTIQGALRAKLPEGMANALMDFQWQGIHFVLEREGRAFIADDMGLGKTVQALALLHLTGDKPALLVVPSSLRLNWAAEIEKWLPHIREEEVFVVLTGRQLTNAKDKRYQKLGTAVFTIVSYDLLARHEKHFKAVTWRFVVLDESHFVKNASAQRTRALLPLCKRAARTLLLSGTPALSRPMELYTQISALQPRLLPSRHSFGMRYCDGKMGAFGMEFKGGTNLTELQLLLRQVVMIRRKKEDVLTQLPAKRRQAVRVVIPKGQLEREFKKLEISHDREWLKQTAASVLGQESGDNQCRAAFMKAFQATAMAKLKATLEHTEMLLNAGVKFLLFGHHRALLDAVEVVFLRALVSKGNGLQAHLKRKRVHFVRVDGRTSAKQKQQFVDEFQQEPSCQVALLSITAASTGYNLTAATTVLFAELYWTPGVLLQAENRCHRIGQRSAVNIQYILGRNSLDDVVWPMISRKLTLLDKTFGGGMEQAMAVECETEEPAVPADQKTLLQCGVTRHRQTAAQPCVPEQWECGGCTHRNDCARSFCEVCFGPQREVVDLTQ